MQKKYHMFFKFCEFKALVEKYTGKKVKALRRNNGGEMVENTSLMNSITYVPQKELKEN